MPAYGAPQSLMYSYRGQQADGNSIRNRGAEQRFSGSGNPQMPMFNTAPSPSQGIQSYGPTDGSQWGDQASQLAARANGVTPLQYAQQQPGADPNAINAALAGRMNTQPTGNNTFGSAIMPQFNGYGGMFGRMPQRGGPQTMSAPNGMRSDASSPLMWQGHQVTPAQMAQIQATNARTAALRANWHPGPSQTPQPPLSAPPMPQFTS